jgi:hypothetical protein
VAEFAEGYAGVLDVVDRCVEDRNHPLGDDRHGAALYGSSGDVVAVRGVVQNGDEGVAGLNFSPVAGAAGDGGAHDPCAAGGRKERIQRNAESLLVRHRTGLLACVPCGLGRTAEAGPHLRGARV